MLLFDWRQWVDLRAEHLSIRDKFDSMVPFLLIWEFVKGLLGEDIFKLLVRFGYYILEARLAGSFCSFCKPLRDCLGGFDLFRVLAMNRTKSRSPRSRSSGSGRAKPGGGSVSLGPGWSSGTSSMHTFRHNFSFGEPLELPAR